MWNILTSQIGGRTRDWCREGPVPRHRPPAAKRHALFEASRLLQETDARSDFSRGSDLKGIMTDMHQLVCRRPRGGFPGVTRRHGSPPADPACAGSRQRPSCTRKLRGIQRILGPGLHLRAAGFSASANPLFSLTATSPRCRPIVDAFSKRFRPAISLSRTTWRSLRSTRCSAPLPSKPGSSMPHGDVVGATRTALRAA